MLLQCSSTVYDDGPTLNYLVSTSRVCCDEPPSHHIIWSICILMRIVPSVPALISEQGCEPIVYFHLKKLMSRVGLKSGYLKNAIIINYSSALFLCNVLTYLPLSSPNLSLSSSSTTSRQLQSQFTTCSGWRRLEVCGKWKNSVIIKTVM